MFKKKKTQKEIDCTLRDAIVKNKLLNTHIDAKVDNKISNAIEELKNELHQEKLDKIKEGVDFGLLRTKQKIEAMSISYNKDQIIEEAKKTLNDAGYVLLTPRQILTSIKRASHES